MNSPSSRGIDSAEAAIRGGGSETVYTALSDAAERLRATSLPPDLARAFDQLAAQVRQPCVVAVVGRVKAGKSTFINALLGEDLAKVGTTETTATINYFRYGVPNQERPVRCHWQSGHITEEDRAFLDALQGNDEDTLRRADGIDHLEYHLLNSYLEQVTLVDTPGTGATVDEHQNRTAEFMRLAGQLRERHHQATERLGGEADAVIYLIGPTARSSDRDIVEEFALATGGQARAFNAVGVMAKIDLQPEIMERKTELAAKASEQLGSYLNAVVPVSAGIERALDQLGSDGLSRLAARLRSIPPPTRAKLLDSEDFFLGLEPAGCPVSIAERETLLGDLPWGVFTTIARVAGDETCPIEAVAPHLRELAGFTTLRTVLDRHFFQRAELLRLFRIVADARQIAHTLRYQHLPAAQQRNIDEVARKARFLAVLDRVRADPVDVAELRQFVETQFRPPSDMTGLVDALDATFDDLFHDLEEHNADFEALHTVDDHLEAFSVAELAELRALFGLHGLETERRLPEGRRELDHVEERQQAWREAAILGRSAGRRLVAERAELRYGQILDALLTSAGNVSG